MGGDLPYVNAEVFCRQQTHCFSEAMSKFNQTRKMGSEDFCKEYLERLELDLKDLGQTSASRLANSFTSRDLHENQ